MDSKFQIMIVDDEMFFRQALVSSINWEGLGLCVSKVAKHAFEALDYIKENPVDIVLTDVRMPVKDGLAMIEDIRKMDKEPIFVLLTGYGEFEYAQRALRLGVREYLLKPVDEETIITLMTRLCNELRQARMERVLYDGAKNLTVSGQSFSQKHSSTVERILHIIEKELSNEELSLKWISHNHVFLNVNYLSKLFQKHTGKRFSAYLMDKRMQQAMAILAEDGYSTVLQIAACVGFGENSGYFSSAFKKYCGYTPTDYRKIFQNMSCN